MTTQIGKFIAEEDDTSLKLRYRYTLSDFVGSILYVLMVFLGGVFLFVAFKDFDFPNLQKVSFWVVTVIGFWLLGFGSYALLAAFYNPTGGIFSVNKLDKTIIIRDFLSSETIPISDIQSVFHELDSSTSPRASFAMLCLKLTNGDTKECFVIRTGTSIDKGKEIELELHRVARKIRDVITNAL